MRNFILRYRVLLAIRAVGMRTTTALRNAGLSPSFLNFTNNDEDMNPLLINLVILCNRSLMIYPSDLFHPNMDKFNTKSTPHSPRRELAGYVITLKDMAQAFKEILDKKKFVSIFRYDTYYSLIGKDRWKLRSTSIINAKEYLAVMDMSLYSFFLRVEAIAWERIRSERRMIGNK